MFKHVLVWKNYIFKKNKKMTFLTTKIVINDGFYNDDNFGVLLYACVGDIWWHVISYTTE